MGRAGPRGTTEASTHRYGNPLRRRQVPVLRSPRAGEASVCRAPFTAEVAEAHEVTGLTAGRARFGPWQSEPRSLAPVWPVTTTLTTSLGAPGARALPPETADRTSAWKGPSPLAPSPVSLQPQPRREQITPARWQPCVAPASPAGHSWPLGRGGRRPWIVVRQEPFPEARLPGGPDRAAPVATRGEGTAAQAWARLSAGRAHTGGTHCQGPRHAPAQDFCSPVCSVLQMSHVSLPLRLQVFAEMSPAQGGLPCHMS